MTIEVKICGIRDEAALQAAVEGGARYVGFVFEKSSRRYVTPEYAAILAQTVPAGVIAVGLFVDPPDEELLAVTGKTKLGMIQLHGRETPQRIAAVRALTGLPVMKAIHVATTEDLAAVPAYEAAADMLLFDTKITKPLSPCGRGSKNLGLQRKPLVFAGEGVSSDDPSPKSLCDFDPLPLRCCAASGDLSPDPPKLEERRRAAGGGCFIPTGGTGKSFDWALLKGRTFAKPWMLAGGLNAGNIAEAVAITGARIIDVSSGVEDDLGNKDAGKIRVLLKKSERFVELKA